MRHWTHQLEAPDDRYLETKVEELQLAYKTLQQLNQQVKLLCMHIYDLERELQNELIKSEGLRAVRLAKSSWHTEYYDIANSEAFDLEHNDLPNFFYATLLYYSALPDSPPSDNSLPPSSSTPNA